MEAELSASAERLFGILSEMKDPQQLSERCRSGGADCDVVDPFYVGKIYSKLLEEAFSDFADAVAGTMREVVDGSCMHCDMRDACAEGEDGMSTACNAVSTANHFIQRWKKQKSDCYSDDLPF